MRLPALLTLLLFTFLRADVRDCSCVLTRPDSPQLRACSLCIEAAKHPSTERIILLRDNDPAKPNRWLAVPRAVFDGSNPLAQMTAADRLELWNTAIAKANEVWGKDWAIAMNGDIARRQCHAHVHIGKLLEGKEDDKGVYIDGPAQLPALNDGTGLWFHPVNGKLHVHTGEQATELVLMK
jgi:diadenosine tetraphosphate (Ap4A) HIT family hydrolase